MTVRVQVAVEQTIGNEVVVNTWAAFSTGAASPLSLVDAALVGTAFAQFYGSSSVVATPNRGIDTERPTELVMTRVVVREILPGGVSGVFFEFGHTNAGQHVGVLLPLSSAIVVSLRTAVAGRSGRGRVYLGPFNQSLQSEQLSSGQWNAAFCQIVADATADLDTRLAALVPNSYTLAVWSRSTDTFNSVTSARVDSKPDSQRRRMNDISPSTTIVAAL